MSGEDERWDEPASGSDQVPAHEQALLAFSTNFEFAKHLVRAQGVPSMTPEARAVLANWLSFLVDGVNGYIDGQKRAGQRPSDELRTLTREAVEARDWLNALAARP